MFASALNSQAGLIPAMSLQTRIQEILDATGLTRAQLARAAGVTPAAVTQWLAGGSKEIKGPNAAGLEGITGYSAAWIATGKGPKKASQSNVLQLPKAGRSESGQAIQGLPSIALDASDVVIPQYDTGGSMGRGIVLAEQPGVIKEWRVSEQWAQQNIHRITALRNLAIVTGFGPSMQPLFNPGDPLLVDRGITRADVDGIYFFRVGEEGFVKQLQRIPSENGLILRAKSYNPLYDPFDITKGMDFEVFARVVKVWKGEEF